MAEIASPARTPRSLRRHYPHQVQGVRLSDVSANRGSPAFMFQNKTGPAQVNARTTGTKFPKYTSIKMTSWPLDLACCPAARGEEGCEETYFAVSFTLVWKTACHPPFAIFQTDPALKLPEASFPS